MSSSKDQLRILVLVHPQLIPPEGATAAAARNTPWEGEFDVLSALTELGHTVRTIGVLDDINGIRTAVHQFEPHLAFNLLEEFDGKAALDHNVVALLELMGLPYTGCNPKGMMVARQKAMAKVVLTHEGLKTPEFQLYPKGEPVRAPEGFTGPWFIKSATEEASLGISQKSIVRTATGFVRRVKFVHSKVDSDVLAERYIDGRELYVGVLGNSDPEAFPVWELKFRRAPKTLPRIATRKVKFDPNYQKRYGITSGKATGLSEALDSQIRDQSLRAYRALGLSGYARMDFRLTAEGELYFLEANPNPHPARIEDFAQAALAAGYTYPQLISQIVTLGLEQRKVG